MNGTTILFGLPGVAVDCVQRDGEGARTVRVVTDDPGAAACPACGVFSTSVKQRRTTSPKDLPYGEVPLRVRWHKAQYRCREQACERKAFTESITELPPRARVTGRCRRAAARAVGSGRSVSSVTGELSMSWPVVHAAFVAHADRLLTEPSAVGVLGIDETRRGRPRWTKNVESGKWERLDRFETNFVDLIGDQGLLGQTAGRTSKAVTDWLDARGEDWKNAVQVVAMDPCSAYRHAVSQALPHARIVADHFHIVRLANEMVTDVRQRVARETLGRRGRSSDPAWVNRRLLLRAGDQLSNRGLDRLITTFATNDPTEEIAAAWAVKEQLRMLLAASDRHTISERLHRFHQTVIAADLPEATRLASTIEAWWPQIEAFCQTRITNAATEGTNRMIKDAARIAFGFRNLDNQRRRVRFHCTRRTRRSTSAEAVKPPQL